MAKKKQLVWKLKEMKISDLKPNPSNPRRLSDHDYDHLKKSIDSFGLIDKPILNSDLTVIGGHQRIEVLKREGIKECECWIPSRTLTEREVRELTIRLNKNTGEWNFDVIANEWDFDELLEFGFKHEDLVLPPEEGIESTAESDPKRDKLKMCPACGHEF